MAMNPVQELRDYIKASGMQSPPSNAQISGSPAHLAVRVRSPSPAYIDANITHHPNALFKRSVPPLDIIILALRALLAAPGTPRLHDIPDVLDFATTIEFYRTLALQKAEEALALHARLSDADVHRLRAHCAADSDLREVYIEMLLQYAQLDIYRLWTRAPPCTAAVTLRLCEYFPALNALYTRTVPQSPRLFHCDLSLAERALLRARGLDCCRFLRDSFAWAAAHGLPLETAFQTAAFADAFPCEISVEKLRNSMEYYMAAIEGMVNELQDMFPQSEAS
ncbi:hypothetical protein B0H15DRAFT_944698 [Mycena belliarum]|uniref:Uncharacterized protein n=1 Tax=Mycena belliarum TaxID=1033014 RepID=A0AAD6UCQ5_9AGAR|nr:hypothetical protein B0H15DRAFT_944698 [Mycena belliae]